MIAAARHHGAQRGLTLIEVIVALAILGLVASSVLSLISQNARFIIGAEDRLAASILADNIMVERLASASPLDEGEDEYEREYASRRWRCLETVTTIGETGLKRIDIAISPLGSTQIIATASTLKAGP